jgi:peptide/nickel transport system substrate-binding protein
VNRRSGIVTVAVTVGGLLLLGACTPQGERPAPDPSAEPSVTSAAAAQTTASSDPCLTTDGAATADGEIAWSGGEAGFTAYNADVVGADTLTNQVVTDLLLGSFWYRGDDGSVCADTEFGKYEVTSTDPLQVTYTLAEGATWSDGVPVTYADFLLDWAAQAITADGAVVGSVDDGSTALFDHRAGLTLGDLVPAGPQAGAADSREFRYDYERVHADWESMVGPPLPAHVVAAQVGVSVDELVDAILDLDLAVLGPAADFWNTGWTATSGVEQDLALTPSSGRYGLTDGWAFGGPVTLTANVTYWGTPAATRELTVRPAASDTHVDALQSGALDVVRPAATVETLTLLEQAGSAVTVSTGPTLTWEHLDLNFAQGVFAESLEAREAFVHCVPRQRIVDELVAPLDEDAAVLDAREVLPFQDGYDDVVRAAYDGRYDIVDLDAAAAKFAAAGLEAGTPVRIGYPAPNQRRAEIVAAIKESCDQVGFDVVDAGDPDFYRSSLYPGTFDVALFAWTASGDVAGGAHISRTGGTQNHGGYSDATVDTAWAALESTLDPVEQLEQTTEIERQLWDTVFSIPLFVHPGIDAYRSEVAGVRPTVAEPGAAWSADRWTRTP